MVKKQLLLIVLLFTTLGFLTAEIDFDASLSGTVTASKEGSEDVTSGGLATGSFTIKSTGNKNVKSQLTLDFTNYRSISALSISKAWVKFRYPSFRATVGKNRITWGAGNAFNAGDVIFDDYNDGEDSEEDLDLTADELKSLNRTMAHLIFPFGRYTFGELIYLPYDFLSDDELLVIASGEYPDDPDLDQHSAGGRFYTRVGGIKLESGYIFNGDTNMHKPYISFDGTLLLDYQASASINIEHGETDFDIWKDTLKVSTGLFYMFDLEDDRSLTLRLESLIYPYGDWDVDALSLYPEVALVPNDELSFFLRSVISPMEFSIDGSFGVNWKTYQGFTIGGYYTLGYEDNSDPLHTVAVTATHKF